MVCLFSDKMSYHYFTKCKFLAMWNETGTKKKKLFVIWKIKNKHNEHTTCKVQMRYRCNKIV